MAVFVPTTRLEVDFDVPLEAVSGQLKHGVSDIWSVAASGDAGEEDAQRAAVFSLADAAWTGEPALDKRCLRN